MLRALGSARKGNAATASQGRLVPLEPDVTRHPAVAILAPCFYPVQCSEPRPSECNWGGGERYLVDLAGLLRRHGFEVHLFQPSAAAWTTDLFGFPLHGLGRYGWGPYEFMHEVSREFTARAPDWGFDQSLYFNVDVSTAATPESLTITHGVWWDQDGANAAWRRSYQPWLSWIARAHTSSRLCVSVDVNGINWARAALGHAVAGQMRYVPNYADEALYPTPAWDSRRERVRILFPRRLVFNRGAGLAIDMAREMLADGWGDRCEFRFVGHGQPHYARAIDDLAAEYPRCVERSEVHMHGMEAEYAAADITLIPTLDCEGTSLSCIEAMAAGNAIVATHAGGISNLVIDGLNGRLVEPGPVFVRSAVEDLVRSDELRLQLGYGARFVFERSFTKALWEQRWGNVLREAQWI